MSTKEQNSEYNIRQVKVLKKPAVQDTLMSMSESTSSVFKTRSLGNIASVRAIIHRLKTLGHNFVISEVYNNGESYIITRLPSTLSHQAS